MRRLLKKITIWIIITLTSNKFKSVLMCCDPLIPITNFNASKVNKIFKIIITTLILKRFFKFAGDWNVYAVDRKQEVINCLVKQFKVVDSQTLVVNDKFR
jgi:hypothetical protein